MSRQAEIQEVLQIMARSKGDNQPCIGCRHSAECADLELACRAFRAWVGNSSWVPSHREPSRRHYIAVMNQEDT